MWQNILNYFNQGWVGSIIGIVGILLGCIGIFSYKISKSSPKPSYQKSSLPLLGRTQDILPKDVKVIYKGQSVNRLTKTTLIIWNNGTEVLNGKDIVHKDPLRISFQEGDKILSHDVLKRTKDVNDFNLKKEEEFPHELYFDFSYLDPNDGISMEILHDSKERHPKLNGTIMGFPKGFEDLGRFDPNRPITGYRESKIPIAILFKYRKLVFLIACAIGIGMVILGILPQDIVEMLFKESDSNMLKMNRSHFFITIGALYAAMPAAILWFRRKKYPKKLEVNDMEIE